MPTYQTSALTPIQLDDARRGALVAAAALRCVAERAGDPYLLAEAQRLCGSLCSVADELAELRDQARVPV
jgi:hypothetical protein